MGHDGRSPWWLRAHAGLVGLAVLGEATGRSRADGVPATVASWLAALLGVPWQVPVGALYGVLGAWTDTAAGTVVLGVTPAVINLVLHALWRRRPRARGSSATAPVVVLAVATAACWGAWMAWDRHRDLDPATGRSTGPYEPWQVVGCVLSLAVVAVLAARWLRTRTVVAVTTVVFTAAWSVSAATAEHVGASLWPIGAVMVALGTAAGTAVVAGGAAAVRGSGTGPDATR